MEQKIIFTKYNVKEFERQEITSSDPFFGDHGDHVAWLSVIGHNSLTIQELGAKLGLHPLVIEDILDTGQNPKLVEYDEYLFLVTENVFYAPDGELTTEQISFVLYKERLLSFREQESAVFNSAVHRLAEGANIRKNGSDDLLYVLLDAIVDNYFLAIENFGQKIDQVEDRLLANPKKELLEEIYRLKRDLIFIRNLIWPMRNVVSSLSKNDYDLVDGKTVYYLRDLYDHVIQVMDIIETYRDICSGMLDTYLSSIGNKTNEVMKVLTIFSTIFIPLTFLAGVYGMNFTYLPELKWRHGYLGFWMISAVLIGFMLRFFKKKDWL